MKQRLLFSIFLAGGLMAMGATSASAGFICTDDPTINVGLPVHYSVNVTLTTKLTWANVYASGTKSTTTFGFGLGVG